MVDRRKNKKTKHTHLILESDRYTLAYDDPRRFGHLYFYTASEAEAKLSQLGMDLADPKLDLEYLKEAINRYPERALKVTLFDQSLFAGSGNYIASEICARAGICSTLKCRLVKNNELPKILKAINEVLTPALASGGI